MSVSSLDSYDSRRAERWLMWAFVISLVAHLFFYGVFLLGDVLGVWKRDSLHKWLTASRPLAALVKKPEAKPAVPQPQEIPLNFIEVDPAAIMAEPPKDAKYYSSKNSHAANKEADKETNIPKIDGSQTHIAKTQTSTQSRATPLRPTAQKAPAKEETQEAKAKPKGGENQKVGDLAMAKPDLHPPSTSKENDTGTAEVPTHARPRTLAEAKDRLPQALRGEKMKQDGGVKRHLVIDAMDAKATPFGEYDREMIEAIQYRWDFLLEEKNYSHEETGKVVIDFKLDLDGHISDVIVVESSVGRIMTLLCQLAITDPAPYAKWPSDMRHVLNSNTREIRFTFYYD